MYLALKAQYLETTFFKTEQKITAPCNLYDLMYFSLSFDIKKLSLVALYKLTNTVWHLFLMSLDKSCSSIRQSDKTLLSLLITWTMCETPSLLFFLSMFLKNLFKKPVKNASNFSFLSVSIFLAKIILKAKFFLWWSVKH